jgi:hypothetical protein
MQTVASLLLQYWSSLQPALEKVLSSSEMQSLLVAKSQGLNSLIQWLITHPSLWNEIAYVIKIILGQYVAL